ncbi:MAG: cytochrome c oxidase subunit 3 [Planctomycetota bacterium]|nr:cytochrome c oxidase subunit 3 [Planctomycetota bacterium]
MRQRDWRLPGDGAWWVFAGAEFATLCMFFVVYAVMRMDAPLEFDVGQARLDPRFGLVNALVLITSGFAVARGVASLPVDPRASSRWYALAAVLGLIFVGIKGVEYADKLGAGLNLSSSSFWFFYYFLTGFHFLHVLLGIGFLVWVSWRLARGPGGEELHVQARSCGVFWHMLDLVWILLFPLVYLL